MLSLLRRSLFLPLLLVSGLAWACSVPVFRYGLEHWAADAYQVLVFHDGPLDAAKQALIKQLSASEHANVQVHVVNVAQAGKDLRGFWEQNGKAEVLVQPPPSLRSKAVVWSGALTTQSVAELLESPMRSELAQRLGDGDSAVWVLLESGDKRADDDAAKALEDYLKHIGETMELPQLDEQDIKNGLVSVPADGLRLNFPMVRLARSDKREAMLIQSLLATEPDLKDSHEPIAFPVFGRGRVLYALVGKGIKLDNVMHAASFLLGSCSCQIKEQNPGADLLMNADWKKLLHADKLLDEALPSASEILGRKPILVPIPDRPVRK
jgi:hypothetical protein